MWSYDYSSGAKGHVTWVSGVIQGKVKDF
jgi:hypothetical protein